MKNFLILTFLISYISYFALETENSTTLQSTMIDTLYILQTTDIHGNLFPYDYFSSQPAERGLAKIHTKVKEYRSLHNNVILVDCGDMIQGTPLTYYFNHLHPEIPHPIIQAMNIMKYDAFAVGNHDIEQGQQTYLRCRQDSQFPWLSANSIQEDGNPFFEPHTILELNGLKIGIIGLTTPAIPMWLDENLYPGINWQDMPKTAKKYAAILRPQVDILIGIFHSGFDETDGADRTALMNLPTDNASGIVARDVIGFDAIFGGHSHNMLPEKKTTISSEHKPLQIISGLWGYHLGVAKIVFEKNDNHFKVLSLSAWLESVQNIKPSAEIMRLSDHHDSVLSYIDTVIGTTEDTLCAQYSRQRDTALVELINKAQMDFTDVDISIAACFDTTMTILPGEIKVKDIYQMYPYENYLYVLQLTGRQLRDFLEYSSRYYMFENGQIKINPNIKGYNFDIIEGINYKLDLTQDPGSRISDLTMSKTSESIKLDGIYNVAINSYRASGGGGHIPAAKALDVPIIFRSDTEIRNILIEYIKKVKTVTSSIDQNWEIITE
jgi:2',3'-cyclic-nucleotide 2'-phosphodiesterase / 3'-nucleotidase